MNESYNSFIKIYLQNLGQKNKMGNEADHVVSNYRGNYPVQINLVNLIMSVRTEGVNFQPSPYNIEEGRFQVKPFMDKAIRNSQFCILPMPQLSEKSLEFMTKYFEKLKGIDDEYHPITNQWRMTRYNVQGHFLEHQDRQKQMEGHQHFGTQIFIPPLSECKFEGGQLKIIQNNESKSILPHARLWTHIIMPLGIKHQVKKVTSGTRISYVKQIWLKENDYPIQTDQDRQIRKLNNPRPIIHPRQTGYVD